MAQIESDQFYERISLKSKGSIKTEKILKYCPPNKPLLYHSRLAVNIVRYSSADKYNQASLYYQCDLRILRKIIKYLRLKNTQLR